MNIRPATVHDARALAEQMKLVVDEDRWLGVQRDRTVAELTERFRAKLVNGDPMFTLDNDQHIVGEIGVHPTGITGVYTLEMWILSDFRGQGWGRRMIDVVLDAGRENGVRKVTLEVWPDNGRAISLYAGCGFEVEGYKRDHYPRLDGSLRSAIMMARFL